MITVRPFRDSDISWVWEAYKKGGVKQPNMSMGKLEFMAWFMGMKSKRQEILVVEDNGSPFCFVAAFFDGWKYEPHVEFVPWVKKRSILTGAITYFNMLARMDTIGVVYVKSLAPTKNLFDHLCKYGCLNYVGMVAKGDYRGDEYIYTISGNAKHPCTSPTPTAGRI